MRNEHERLIQVVRSVRRRWRFRVLLRGVAVLLSSFLALLLLAGYAIDASRFDAGAVAVARVLAYLAFAVLLLRVLVWPLLRRVSDEQVALYLEEHEPALGGRVLSAVELGRDPGGAASSALVGRLVESAVEECRKVEDGKRVERSGLRRSSGLVAGSTVFGLGLFVAGPAFLHHTTPLLLSPFRQSEVHNPYRILVEPGDATLAKGSDLRVTAALESFDTADVDLVVRGGEEEWTRWSMLRDDDGARYSLIVFDLHEPTEYFVEASGVRSPVYKVEVMELPYVEDIHLTYRFPAYTGLEPVEQPGSGDIAALVGTEVRLKITPTLPVPGGAVEVEGAAPAPLVAGENGQLGGSITVREPGSYRILLDSEPQGERVVASPDYLIDPLADQPPTLVLTKPGRDLKVTSLEEVTAEVKAQDDYGVSRLELVYSVNGGEEQTVALYSGTPGRKDFVGAHTLYLEEYALQPGDLVSYYARALDAYDGGDPHEAVSDIYFMEIRPFDLNYRQADQKGQPGEGMAGEDLSSRQRMIISATFKLTRHKSAAADGDLDDISTIAMSQGRLRGEVLGLLERIAGAGLAGEEGPLSDMFEALPQAAEAMSRAEEALGERRPEAALAPEQKALQHLQRVEAAFRDIRVARSEQNGGGGAGEINQELTDLFEAEMDQLRNQYEQVRRGNQQDVDDTIDETLEKLRELARRQQQENERMRARARQVGQQARAGSSGASQRQLAEEAEEVARKLERLAREESLPELAETARRLRQAAEEMRRAAASGERTGEALGSSALEELREARRQLERGKSGRLERDTRRAVDRTRRLRDQQERMVGQVDRLDPDAVGYDEALDRLLRAKEQMGGEVGSLEADLDQLSRDFKREQPEASRRLEEAVEEIRDNKIREKILYSRGVVQQRSRDYARNFEKHIEDTLGRVEERLRAAAGAIGESREQRLERALETTREVTTALESLEERLRAGGEGRQGDPQGDPGASMQSGTGALRPRELRQLGRELDDRREQLERLGGQLREEGIEAADLERIIDRLRELGAGGSLAGPETLAVLEQDVVQGLKEFEYGLRRSLGPGEDERLLQVSDDEVPDGYEEMVESYFKALAGGSGSP